MDSLATAIAQPDSVAHIVVLQNSGPSWWNILFFLLGGGITGIVTLWVRWRQARIAEEQSRFSAGGRVASALAAISEQYLDRSFASTDAPEIGGETVTSLRSAKRKLVKEYRSGEVDGQTTIEDILQTAWLRHKATRIKWIRDSDIKSQRPANQIAFELAVALERIGLSVFAGGIDLALVLGLAADEIIADWPLCEAWVASYRERNPTLVNRDDDIAYHRRHAEWLVLLSFLWMSREFPDYPHLRAIEEDFHGRAGIEKRFKGLCQVDAELLSKERKRTIERLSGVDLD